MPNPALASIRSASSTAVRISLGSASSRSHRLPVGQQHGDHLADHVGGGLVPGDQQAHPGGEQLDVGHRLALGVGDGDQLADQVLARLRRFAATCAAMYAQNSPIAGGDLVLAEPVRLSIMSDHWANRSRSSAGTPSMSQMT